MNNYILIGKIINTFGIKGELKVLSNFEYKNRIFIKDFNIYIGEEKVKEKIFSHRIHKNYDLILFNNYNNINEVLKYKNKNIYVLRSDLVLSNNEYLYSDLVGLNVYDDDNYIGVVIDYNINNTQTLLTISYDNKKYYIPLVDNYIKKIDINNKRIDTLKGSDLIL